MKILVVTNTFENVSNGPAKFANYLLDMNKMFDHLEVKILTEDVSVISNHIYSEHIFRLDLKLDFWTRPWGFVYRMFPYYRACAKIRRNFAFDIVVFNNAITGIWSALRLDIPVLGMINDDNNLLVYRKNFEPSKTWLRQLIFHYLEKVACKFETGIITNSKYLHDLVLKEYKPERAKLHILHKGTKVNRDTEFREINPDLPLKILFVKSDYIRGGLFDLIEALAILTRYHFELQIIGPQDSSKSKIHTNANFPNIDITFLGPKTPVEVQHRMITSDFFIVPSHREALGVANLEALSNGLTVISTNVGGIPEALDYGNNGWMAEPGNTEKLASLIQYVIQNPEERLQKQKNGVVFISRSFTQTHVLNNFLEILDHHKL